MVRLALLLLSIPLLAHGGEAVYRAARDRQMTTVSCEQFMQAPPDARWLRVTGCDIDYMHPGFSTSGNRVTELFFAMRLRNGQQDAPAALVVATRDAQALAVGQQALGNGTEIDAEAFTVAMLRVVDVLRAAREVDGYARTGVVERLLTRRALAGFSSPLTSDAIVLDLHSRPSFLRPGLEAGAGLLLLGAAALRRHRTPAGAEHAESAEGVGETGTAASEAETPAVLERRLPALMLLNLEPSAPLSDIEYAPPLGNPQEVAAQIADVLGPLTDEGGGRYSIAGSGWRLGFDIGRDDPVWTVTADVHGSDLALDALDRLTRETSWRVYVPRFGTFR